MKMSASWLYGMDGSSPREGAALTVADALQIPRERSMQAQCASGQCYLTDTGGLQTKDQSNENNSCHLLQATIYPNNVTREI
jgi:hypothetical protein